MIVASAMVHHWRHSSSSTAREVSEHSDRTHEIESLTVADALEMLSIIPRPPVFISLEDTPVEDLTMEQMQDLIRQQRDDLAAMARLKQEAKEERHRLALQAKRAATLQALRGGSVPSISLVDGVEGVESMAGSKRKIEVLELSDSEDDRDSLRSETMIQDS